MRIVSILAIIAATTSPAIASVETDNRRAGSYELTRSFIAFPQPVHVAELSEQERENGIAELSARERETDIAELSARERETDIAELSARERETDIAELSARERENGIA